MLVAVDLPCSRSSFCAPPSCCAPREKRKDSSGAKESAKGQIFCWAELARNARLSSFEQAGDQR
jgi:hypothetical protein